MAVAAALREDQQDESSRAPLQLAGREPPPSVLTREEEADIEASTAAESRGEFATDAEIRAIRVNYGVCRTSP